MSTARDPLPGTLMLLLARAHVARRLVARGRLHPEDALALAVWPPDRVREAEAKTEFGTLNARAYGRLAE